MKKLSVIFVTQDDPIYVGTFWRELSKDSEDLYKLGVEIEKIIILKPLGKRSRTDLLKQLINFYGLAGTVKVGFEYIKRRFCYESLRSVARKLRTEVLYLDNVNCKEFIEHASRVDIVFSIAASQIFKKELLNAPKYGCFNIHSGPLPYYKGMMPVFWQLLDGKEEIGITIHKMVEKLDAGPIIMQEFVDISDCKSLHEAIEKTKRHGAKMLRAFLENFEHIATKNNMGVAVMEKGTYFSFPTREDAKKLKMKGKKLI